MSYRTYPIIYLNGEFILRIKEEVLANIFRGSRIHVLQMEQVEIFRRNLTSHCELLLHALRSDVTSTRSDIVKQLYSIVKQTADRISNSLQYFRDESEWLCMNIAKSDPESLKIWWEMADHVTNFDKGFQELLTVFKKDSKLYLDVAERYKQELQ